MVGHRIGYHCYLITLLVDTLLAPRTRGGLSSGQSWTSYMASFSLSCFLPVRKCHTAQTVNRFQFFFRFLLCYFTRQSPIIYKAESEKKIETDFPTTWYGIYGLIKNQSEKQ